MTGGIRPRLERLTKPAMKQFVSEAVAVATDPAGKKLMVELNKSWATALKSFQSHEKLVAIVEKGMTKMGAQARDLTPEFFAEMQSLIDYAQMELKPVAAAVKKFETVEDQLIKKYPTLHLVDRPGGRLPG